MEESLELTEIAGGQDRTRNARWFEIQLVTNKTEVAGVLFIFRVSQNDKSFPQVASTETSLQRGLVVDSVEIS